MAGVADATEGTGSAGAAGAGATGAASDAGVPRDCAERDLVASNVRMTANTAVVTIIGTMTAVRENMPERSITRL